jgi:hypothetical protein
MKKGTIFERRKTMLNSYSTVKTSGQLNEKVCEYDDHVGNIVKVQWNAWEVFEGYNVL